MLSNLNKEFEQFLKQRSTLRNTLESTNAALNDISAVDIFPIDEIRNKVLTKNILNTLDHYLGCHPTFIILGPNYVSKAKVANELLGEKFFQPKKVENLKWVHIFNGKSVQVSVLFNWDTRNNTLFRNKATPWTASPVVDDDDDDGKPGVKRTKEETDRIGFEVAHPKLENNFHIIMTSEKILFLNRAIFSQTLPIVLYVLEESVCAETIEELRELRQLYKDLPVFFIYAPDPDSPCVDKLAYLAREVPEDTDDPVDILNRKKTSVIHHLALLGYINVDDNSDTAELKSKMSAKSKLVYGIDQVSTLPQFVHNCLQTYFIRSAQILNDIHCCCLRQFILSAFDMAREIQITPKRILYAQEKEAELFKNLTDFATKKQEELYDLIQTILKEKREELVMKAVNYKYRGLKHEAVGSYQDLRNASSEIHFLIFSELNTEISSQIVQLVDCLHDTFIGTLQRCLESLERDEFEQEDNIRASDAVNQILNVAYHIEISESNPSSVIHSFLEKLRRLVHSINLPWRLPIRVDEPWRRHIAEQMIQSLSPARVVKNIFSTQFRDRLKASHSAFNIAIRALQDHYVDRLERTEEQRIAIRKFHAPKMARLALESMSLCDMLRYGMPHLMKEIGRGQYGVVYSCDSWGGAGPCAVKSVVPPDDKHWNDLSLEFYYTRTVPEHKRIVRLRGSVVDHTYGGGCSPAVLLIMDRLSRDLYTGLRSGLSWVIRLQITIDVVEGIRYLHSLGLVHRDIKLKNVLLDEENRAKLTDLGFCIPGAMMSGSIVGTPLHMAPELLSGHYDNSVDVYAFGILFWYICAGNVRLPLVFENFQNKEQLWSNVRKGIRPERLQHFDDQCWKLMQECWAGEPSKRPLLGYVQPLLESILDKYLNASTRGSLSE